MATRDCQRCLKYVYDKHGNEERLRKGGPMPRPVDREINGKLVKGAPAPCRTASGCPKGTPEAPKSLNEKNEQAYQHYLECKVTGQWPDDPIVRRNAALIGRVQEASEKGQQQLMTELVAAIAQTRLVEPGRPQREKR